MASLMLLSAAPQRGWNTFESTARFSVAYPTDWQIFGVSRDRLQIRSSGRGADGVIINRGQAAITVLQVASGANGLESAIKRSNEGAEIISRQRIQTGGAEIIKVISRAPAVPPGDIAPGKAPDEVNTQFFVLVASRVVCVSLINWDGDTKQAEYQEIAARMARSVRPQPHGAQ